MAAYDELITLLAHDAVPNNDPVKLPVNEPVVFVGAKDALRAYDALNA